MSLNLIMGARNGAKNIREKNDFYATHPQAVRLFLGDLGKRLQRRNNYKVDIGGNNG